MTLVTTRICRVCGTRRRLTDVVAVIHRVNGHRTYVCRPAIRQGCFRDVAFEERIESPGDPRNVNFRPPAA